MPTLTTEQLQQQLEELKRRFEEAMNEEANFRQNFETLYATVVNRAVSREEISESRTPSIPGVPAWLSPILQGVTIMVLLGAIFWVGQTTGTISTKVDNLQKSADKINDWKDTASVSLGSLNTKVDGLNSKIDDLSKTKK
jgi:peptidoglycan hydrolase CwlO-like protein